MKKIFLLLVLVVFLSSCGSSDEGNDEKVTGLIQFVWNSFEMSLPSNWNILSGTGNTILPKPKNGDIVLAASSNELKYGFSNNILVLSQDIQKPVTSWDFSILNNVWSTKEYLEYIKLESKSIEFADKDSSNLYIFEAKYNEKTPKLKFLQVGKICNYSHAYLLTVALSTDIKDTSKYEEVIKTFQCK